MGKSAQSTYCAIRLLLALGFAIPGAIPGALCAQPATATAEAERMRRLAGVEEAEMLLQKGDEAYSQGDFANAAEAYAGARELLADAPLTAELRRAATDRYAQASVEHGRALVRKGDLAAASAVVDRVLQKDAAPDDAGALAFRAYLDDPIRTNPALDAKHAANIDQVRRLLYTAEGAYELGKFDEAKKHYGSILQIDATNTAARRGMERVDREIQAYAGAAYDHTRAAMLADVDKQWETPTASTFDAASDGLERGAAGQGADSGIAVLLDQIRLDQVLLSQATLSEAVDYLRSVSRVPGPGGQAINYNLNLGPDDSARATKIRAMKFDLQLNDVPLRHVLRVITEMTRTTFTTDAYSVVIRPLGSDSSELFERNFRVPPDFLTALAAGGGPNAPEANDPFAANTPTGSGLLTARMSAQDAFARQGVGFPEGAYANYSPSTSILRVRNTENNLDVIQQIVDSIAQTEPVMVAVRVTMITTLKQNLEELGFDWLLSPVALGDDVFGAGGTIGNTPGRTGADFISPINGAQVPGVPLDPSGAVTNGLLTNGLRSGDYQTTGNSLSELLADPSRAGQQSSVAPGILSLTGLFTDGQVQLVMRGLSQKKGVDIMARPSTVTRSGQQSTVEIIQEFIYPTEYEPPEIPTNVGDGNTGGAAPVTPAMPTSFETRPVGVELQVLPLADPEKRYVDITLQPSFSKFDGFVNYGSPIVTSVPNLLGGATTQELTENAILMPVFSVQRTNTQLTIADGATVVFGGLLTDRIQKGEDKVPVLGQLPMIGRLFSSESSQPITTAIIFMVQVELIDPTGRPYRDR
jgi:general secretion pathway protein D